LPVIRHANHRHRRSPSCAYRDEQVDDTICTDSTRSRCALVRLWFPAPLIEPPDPLPLVAVPVVPLPVVPEPVVPLPVVAEPVDPLPVVPEPVVPEPLVPLPVVADPVELLPLEEELPLVDMSACPTIVTSWFRCFRSSLVFPSSRYIEPEPLIALVDPLPVVPVADEPDPVEPEPVVPEPVVPEPVEPEVVEPEPVALVEPPAAVPLDPVRDPDEAPIDTPVSTNCSDPPAAVREDDPLDAVPDPVDALPDVPVIPPPIDCASFKQPVIVSRSFDDERDCVDEEPLVCAASVVAHASAAAAAAASVAYLVRVCSVFINDPPGECDSNRHSVQSWRHAAPRFVPTVARSSTQSSAPIRR